MGGEKGDEMEAERRELDGRVEAGEGKGEVVVECFRLFFCFCGDEFGR